MDAFAPAGAAPPDVRDDQSENNTRSISPLPKLDRSNRDPGGGQLAAGAAGRAEQGGRGGRGGQLLKVEGCLGEAAAAAAAALGAQLLVAGEGRRTEETGRLEELGRW